MTTVTRTMLGLSSTLVYSSSMATTTSSKKSTSKKTAPKAAPAAAPLVSPESLKQALPFVPAAVIDRFAPTVDVDAARALVLERVEENQKAVLAAVKKATATVERFVPALPGDEFVRSAVRTNVDFAVKLAKKQAEFVGKVVKTVAA